LREILALHPDNAHIHIRISEEYKAAGRFREAEQAVRAALDLKPTAAAYHRLSQLLDAQSFTAEAVTAIQEACKLDPANRTYQKRLRQLTAGNAASREAADDSGGENARVVVSRVPLGPEADRET
jgi:predicted Zn-dependent protease